MSLVRLSEYQLSVDIVYDRWPSWCKIAAEYSHLMLPRLLDNVMGGLGIQSQLYLMTLRFDRSS